MDDRPYWVILLMYRSHDMRHTGFRGLMVVNGPPGFGASHNRVEFRCSKNHNKEKIKNANNKFFVHLFFSEIQKKIKHS